MSQAHSARRDGFDDFRAEDGQGEESKLEGRLCGSQIWRGAGLDSLEQIQVNPIGKSVDSAVCVCDRRHLNHTGEKEMQTDLLDCIVIPECTGTCKRRKLSRIEFYEFWGRENGQDSNVCVSGEGESEASHAQGRV